MRASSHAERFLVSGFLVLVFLVPLSQAVIDMRRGDPVRALQVFKTRPSAKQLRAYEHGLEDASFWGAKLRPSAQFARFAWFRDGGDKVTIGREGWLFYGPGVRYVTERPGLGEHPRASDAAAAIIDFRDQLRARGIQLVVVPAPNKESVYPEKLTPRAAAAGPIPSPETGALLGALRDAGVETVNLFERFAAAKTGDTSSEALYLKHDSHWSPAGLELAARAVAERVVANGSIGKGASAFAERSVELQRIGDILRMLQVPALERRTAPEPIICRQVTISGGEKTYKDDPNASVLVLGDSFLRIFQTDEPGAAGFVSHLAYELRQPVTSLISDGGASTIVRQELNRRAGLLRGKKVVVWEFVERDIRLGAEGWRKIPLPKE